MRWETFGTTTREEANLSHRNNSPHSGGDLPPRDVLDAWDVPGPPLDLEDRIMGAFPGGRARSGSANPLTLVVPLVAGVAAAALVLIWMTLVRVDEGAPAAPAPAVESTSEVPPVSGVAEAAVERGGATLVLDVSPDAAVVEVDGRWIAGPAPFIATPLSVGEHRLKVRAEGRISVERTLRLGAGTTELPISLASRQVVVSVETVPASAEVTFEVRDPQGENRKEATHVIEIDRDPQARYFIEARASGHLPRRVEIGFDGNPAQRLTIVLPEDASAKPRPSKRGGSPLEKFFRKSGKRESGSSSSASPLVLTPKPERSGPLSTLPWSPSAKKPTKKKPDPALATLRIGTDSGAPPAKIYIDGKFIGTTPQFNSKVKPGRHKVKWKWSSGKVVTRMVIVAAGETKVLKAS